ncbi:glycoside hydrolase family 2 protein [Reichenbachiella ulvae]|uniref:DUF4982 domain-containing protein n=1 Tax=Reichenbachiella ulvae TaxID=2980104 RepID=A0ABT3CVS7_9BACT|nr:sugar-binding domain-containing protein [Reichenbachiella ulvae]MCV9387343.1 DUF4982 domain-containing protein [Reichenbachiella ulvae]
MKFLESIKLKALLGLVLTLFYFSEGGAQNPSADLRTKYNFNQEWKLLVGDPEGAEKVGHNDDQWKEVTLPYAWNENEAYKNDIHNLSTGIAWYRKQFQLPKDLEGKKVFLEFEGVRQGGDFYVNGQYIGHHDNGVMAFGFDISELVNFGSESNTLAVRTDNSWDYKELHTGVKHQWNNDNFNANYGGLPKNVYLHVSDRLYQTLPLFSTLGTTGVYVYAREFDIPGRKAVIFAESQVKNEYAVAKTFQYQVEIRDMDGETIKVMDGNSVTISPGGVATAKASAMVEGLNFWSWGYGYLYDVYTRLKMDGQVIDEVKTTTGFRKTEFANGMIKLNDRVIMVKGYAQRTSNEWPAVGMSVPAWLSDYSNRLMVETNANLVRWMHVTPWKQDVESCDRVGLMQAMPAGDAEKDVKGRQWEQRVELMRDAIIYNRNNPSIVFYEGGNESISEVHMKELKDVRDQYDPYGGRAAGSREMLDSEVAEYGGEMLYINKSADIPFWATEYSRDEGLRKYWDEFSPPYHKDGDGGTDHTNINGTKVKDASPYNRNQDSHAKEDVIRWYDYWRERPGTGKRVSSGGVNIIFTDTNTHYRGAENYRRSGEADPMRIPKDGFYAHQVMWDGWVDTESRMAHLMGHWNYKEGTVKDMYAVSSAEKVELFVNGKSKGFGERSYHFLFTFEDIKWEEGSVKVVGYDESGKAVCEDENVTAGEPVAIRLTTLTNPTGFKADGADMALIEVEVVDAQGRRNPIAFNEIDFSLDGQAEWLGGIAQGPDNYILSKKLPVELGVNRVLIRSTTKAGKISLTAKSEGLNSASIKLKTQPIEVEGGLSDKLPGADLPSNLERGPTPLEPSYEVTRVPVEIVSATAGINSDQARQSFDDNELSNWSNNNILEQGWIKYQFDSSYQVSEVVLKMNSWRRRSYPIEIKVGDKTVFKGNTERSLGYITIPFEPVSGDNLTVKLIGTTINEDAFNIVEITGKKDLVKDGYREEEPPEGILSIVEIEVYQE